MKHVSKKGRTTGISLPSWYTYCEKTTAANALAFELDGITVWFSYKTPVAFRVDGYSVVVRANAWGPTTGKHLNYIDDGYKTRRVSGSAFAASLALQLEGMGA